MSDIRVFIESDSITSTQVFPDFGETTDFDLSRQEDQVFFLTEFPTLTFRGTDHLMIKALGGCEKLTITVEERCQGDWNEAHVATFTQYDEKINENQCWGEVKPVTKDQYTCILDNWDLEKVVFTAGLVTSTQALQGTYEAPTALCCQQCYPPGIIPTMPICAVPAGYCWTGENYDDGINPIACGNFTDHRYRSCFHRILGQGTPTTPPPYGSGWTHLTGNDWYRCPSAEELETGVFANGRLFSDVLTYLVGQQFCGLTVKSHFFNINPTNPVAPDNDAYDYANANLQHMTIHQKSDVLRPYADDPAESGVWTMTLKKLLDDLRKMFQVYWKIVGTDLIIEHITYFTAGTGLDLSNQDLVLEYGKVDTGAPKTEYYFWSDRAGYFAAFAGQPIKYDCGNKGDEYQVSLFDTDIRYIRTTKNPEAIKDSDFVLIANTVSAFKYYVINFNEPLGWVSLHENLHRDYRYFLEGTMNGVETTFNSARKTRELAPFSITVCCDDVFNPEDDIMTSIGAASPQKITINYNTGNNARELTITANV